MKRDDFGMRIDNIRELATKYSKPELGNMVRMGMVSPQEALMAGMMIDRIAKSAMQPPQTTVAEDVLGQQQAPQGMMAAPGAPPPSAGVAGLPSNLQNMAGGGIVAFADGGTPEDMVRASRAADAALAGMSSQDGLTLPGGFKFREYAPQQPTDIKTEIGKEREALQEAGVDLDLYKRMREEESGRKEELSKRREEAKGEALLMAGLGLMGARKGQEFQALSEVGRQAVQQYSGALREIRDTEKDIKKTQRELMFAEDRAKRDMSGKALGRVQAKQDKLDDLQTRQTDQYNKAAEKASDLFITKYGIDENAKKSLEVAKTSGEYQIKVAQIHAATAGKPGETERLLNRYHDILAKEGPEAANKFMSDIGQIRGVGKPQNTLSYEEALKFLAQSDPTFGMKPIEEKNKLVTELMKLDPMRINAPGQSTVKNPFTLSPEAQAALKQYGGK